MINVAIIDDNLDILASIQEYFIDISNVAISAFDSIDDFWKNKSGGFDIILLDIVLPKITGLEALPQIKDSYPNTEVVMFTIQEDAESLFKAFQNGASGYLLKGSSLENLNEYFKIIRNGGSAISAKMAQYLIRHITDDYKPLEILNAKEFQVLELLAEGWSYKLIADKSGLSIDGVRFYIRHLSYITA